MREEKVRIVRQLEASLWKEFVDEHSQGNIFHTPEMFEVFRRAEGHRPELWAATKNGEVLALLPSVRITLKGGLLRFLTTRSTAYGSVLCAPTEEGQQALTKLLQTCNREAKGGTLFTELRNLSDLGAVQSVLEDNGFDYEGHLNFLIDLERPAEEIWSSVDGNVRTNVRKARRMGVAIKKVTVLDEVPAAYAVLASVYERIAVPLAPLSLFESAFDVLYPQGMIALFEAYVKDTCIGVAFRLLYKDVIYAWYAGSIMKYAKYKPNDLLNWHVLEWGAQNGFKYFDFGGAGKPGEDYGPRKFKSKFGGTVVNYGRNTCVHHPVAFQVSKYAYQIARRFLSW
jgi:serine/alanine adding enzyme